MAENTFNEYFYKRMQDQNFKKLFLELEPEENKYIDSVLKNAAKEEAILKFKEQEELKHIEPEIESTEVVEGYVLGLMKFAASIGKTLNISFS